MEGHCQEGHESLEDQGGMGQWQDEMERSLKDRLLCTGGRKVRVLHQ